MHCCVFDDNLRRCPFRMAAMRVETTIASPSIPFTVESTKLFAWRILDAPLVRLGLHASHVGHVQVIPRLFKRGERGAILLLYACCLSLDTKHFDDDLMSRHDATIADLMIASAPLTYDSDVGMDTIDGVTFVRIEMPIV